MSVNEISITLWYQLRMINSKLSLRRSEADAGASQKCYHSERHLVSYITRQIRIYRDNTYNFLGGKE